VRSENNLTNHNNPQLHTMKECFVEKNFKPESLKIIATAEQILGEYARMGYDLSLRQLYYQFVARDLLANNERNYKMLGNIISDARDAGLIDWSMIKDRGRTLETLSHWNSPADIVFACAEQFRFDKWAKQPNYVEVMVEKQALEGVLLPECHKLDVPFMANKGYSSASALYEAGKRYRRATEAGKEVHLIYLGDHDPSGIDMSRDVLDRARLYSGEGYRDLNYDVVVHRIALNMDQIDELNPPENPAKLTDSRANDYIAKFGESSWELDAIEPRALARLVREAILGLRDADIWAESVESEQKAKETLENAAQMIADGDIS